MKHLINIMDFSAAEIDELIAVADDMMAEPGKYRETCRGRQLATLFFEPSTRTRLSFESAMLSLGGNIIGFSDATSSSVVKGESVADTATIVSGYADIIAMRHPKEGAPLVAARHSSVPLINAGDGGLFHPTQTLTDLLTIRHEKGRFEDLTVGLCGDLRFGRTVHSLIAAMSRYAGVRFVLISPTELMLPDFIKKTYLSGIPCVESDSLDAVIGDLDILYMTRVQKERFSDDEAYQRLKDSYILTADKMKAARRDMIVMHPLPRVNEIDTAVDEDPRACYFRQARYGKFIRMALILKLLETAHEPAETECLPAPVEGLCCLNPRCITTAERGLAQAFVPTDGAKTTYRCYYCDTEIEKA